MVFNRHAARNIIGIIGNVICFGLFASPIPTFVEIWKSKSIGQFKADPYLATIMNCMLWNFYGLPIVHPGSTLVVTINSTGLVLETIYITIYFTYAHRKDRMKIIGIIFMELVLLAALVSIVLTLCDTHRQRSTVVGIFCVIINVLMYASPLTIMKRVITTKSVEYMPFCLSLATFLNAIIWILYAVIDIFDLYILIANSLGLLSGIIQLILYAYYYKSVPTLKVDHVLQNPPEVQLSIEEDK